MGETMASDIVGHQFYDDQIDYDYIPQDVFLEENAYDMEISEGAFRVNTQEYQALIVPKLQFVTSHMKEAGKKTAGVTFPGIFYRRTAGRRRRRSRTAYGDCVTAPWSGGGRAFDRAGKQPGTLLSL